MDGSSARGSCGAAVPGSPYSLPGGKAFFVSICPEATGIRD